MGRYACAKVSLSASYNPSYALIPSSVRHISEQDSAFAQKWQQCDEYKEQHLNIMLEQDNWQFKRQNPKNIRECGWKNKTRDDDA